MTSEPTTVTSADGTTIAFDLLGEGPPLVVLGGMLCDRTTTRELADALATSCRVANVDRRGRGASGTTPPYAVEREVDDVAAVIGALGGTAAVYGHSSGAGLALQAAAAGLPISRLVLHEPPYGADDDESRASARALTRDVERHLADGRPGDAIARFMGDAGMPDEAVAAMAADPRMLALAATMGHDLAVMGDDEGGTVPEDLVRSVRTPTLVIAGGASPDFFRDTADRLAELLADVASTVLDGQDHGAPAEVVAPVVAAFVTA